MAVLRSTALRRVVEYILGHHQELYREPGSSLRPGLNTVRPHPSGSGRSVLTPGPPPTAQQQSSAAPLVRRGQKTVIGTLAREVDRPFHINAGSVSLSRRFQLLHRSHGLGLKTLLALLGLELHLLAFGQLAIARALDS